MLRNAWEQMERLLWSLRKGFLLPARRVVLGLSSRVKVRTSRGRRHGLVELKKDIEKCSGYRDIQVMWEMIHSSESGGLPTQCNSTRKTWSNLRCFIRLRKFD